MTRGETWGQAATVPGDALTRSPARQRDSFRPSGGFTRFYYSAALSSFKDGVKG